MTIEALKSRKMKILGLIFNNACREKKIILKDNPDIVKTISRQKIFGVLPWNKDYKLLYKKFIVIAKNMSL